jgi:flavin reductase (DIM6/NTAB) family NADH-FMN oxidoreductase RutF
MIKINELEGLYRTNFFNTLTGYKSANLIGTLSADGIENLAIFNSVIHIGANPPLIGFILRPKSVERHTYNNLITSKYYSINHVHDGIIKNAHQTSAKYAPDVSEFNSCGLTPEYYEHFPSPFVKESRIKIGMKFVEEHVVRANQTSLIVGEVCQVLIDDIFVNKDGSINLPAAKTVAISGLDTYLSASKLDKLPYARP